jgi:acyl-CoA reductase-like NAD-dependent aldehyde dehydrogenase
MKMYVAGQWIDKANTIEVRNSYDGSVIDTVPRAEGADVERALQSAERGARAMAKLTSGGRSSTRRPTSWRRASRSSAR